jgi:hypothetical protein
MKTQFYLIVVSAAALALNVSTSSGQVVDSDEVLSNRAIAASPRAKEVFPWLTRGTATAVKPTKTALADLTKNRAFAASPRMLEQFPELSRPAERARPADGSVVAAVIKNRALAASPRAKEEFAWLARGNYAVTEEPFQIAPLK